MARGVLAQAGTVVVFALTTLAACDRGVPTDASYARNSNNGKGPSSSAEVPKMVISPTQWTLGVGQKANVSVTYRDAKGNVVPDTDFRWTYYGCVPVVPAVTNCYDLVSILPLSPSLRQAQITGMAPSQVRLYASDGLGTYVWSDLTIQ